MLILFLVFSIIHARGMPLAGGPETDPTIAHTIVFGIQPRADGSNTGTRTLYDIIRSCLFTIAACVFRAIHQNIPDPNATIWGKLRVRAKITIYAVIAPEMMIWWAMRQRFGAVWIAREVNLLKPELKWTQTHGHFAQMGGFAQKDTKCVIFPERMIELLKEDLIAIDQLCVSKEDIDDKSKGDILSKGLVTFQTTWFIFECITRLRQKLPLIELEVITLAFAVLNIFTYALWWHKPLNVNRPFFIHVRSEREYSDDQQPEEIATPVGLAAMAEEDREEDDSNVTSGDEGLLSKARTAVDGMLLAVKRDLKKRPFRKTLFKWLFSKPFIAIITPLFDLYQQTSIKANVTHVSTFYGTNILPHETDRVQRLSSLIGIGFGAIHFLSWDASFPSHTQLFLWRISSVVLVAQPGLILFTNFADTVVASLQDDTCLHSIANTILIVCFGFCVTFGGIAYILARMCVIILAFLTLRDLPPHALDSISWTSYIPHL